MGIGKSPVMLFLTLLSAQITIASAQDIGHPSSTNDASGESSITSLPIPPRDLERALAATNRFLDLLAADRYDDAWNFLGDIGRALTTLESWRNEFVAARAKEGRRLSSEFLGAVKTDTVPGGPRGNYIIVGLETRFEKARVKETVSLTLQHGNWMVIGYVAR